MGKNRRAAPLLAVDRSAEHITFTMNPQTAHAVAQSLTLGLLDYAEWRDDIVTMLTAAANREGIFSQTMPTISRGEFDRGHWSLPTDDEYEQTAGTMRTGDTAAQLDELSSTVSTSVEAASPSLVAAPIAAADRSGDAVSPDAAVAVVAEAVAIATRQAKSLAVAMAADAAAETASQTATAVQHRAEMSATTVADAAADALEMLVLNGELPPQS